MGFLDALGKGVGGALGGGVVGAGMGLLLEGHNDRRQIEQQQKLTDMQVKAQQQMGLFNYEQQMKLWHDTNYKAQMDELRKAGLNPSLLYGGGGGQGVTASLSGNSSVSGGEAPKGGGEAMGMGLMAGQMALQAQTQQAQIDLMKAEADKARAEAENKRGVERTGGELANTYASRTMEDRVKTAENLSTKIFAEGLQISTAVQQMNEIFPSQKEKLTADIENIKKNTQNQDQQIKESKQAILKMQQDVKESIQRINESKTRQDYMYEEIQNLIATRGLTYQQQQNIEQQTRNLMKTADLLNYQKQLNDEGYNNPVTRTILGIIERAGAARLSPQQLTIEQFDDGHGNKSTNMRRH